MSALAQARDGKPIGEDFVVFLENTTQQLAGFATEQRQHTAVLLDSHLSTVTELLEHGRYTHALGLCLHTLAASCCPFKVRPGEASRYPRPGRRCGR